MNLARKLSLVLALLGAAVLAGQSVFELTRDAKLHLEDARADHRLLGRTLAGSMTSAWQRGEDAALDVLRQANLFQQQIVVRWVWLDDPAAKDKPRIPIAQLEPLAGRGYLLFEATDHDRPMFISYVPLRAMGRPGAIELSERVPGGTEIAWRALNSVAVSFVLLLILYLVAAMVMSRVLIGQPVRALTQMAQQLETGNLAARVHSSRRDEFGLLATAMNEMASGLEEAKARLAEEQAAKHALEEGIRHADRLSTVGKLAAGVAHELGTPLNVVGGRAKLIASGELLEREAQDSASIIQEQVQAMSKIIRQLLDFARRGPPMRVIEPLEPLVRRTLELLQPLAAKKRIHLTEDIPSGAKALIDPAAIGQVLTNLELNAIQAMERPGEVRVRAAEETRAPPPELSSPNRSWLRLDVEDDGPGIRPELRQRIFEPFFTTKGIGDGTGLGLSVSYGIVHDHGGWIAVDPAYQPGTRFSIYLPTEGGG